MPQISFARECGCESNIPCQISLYTASQRIKVSCLEFVVACWLPVAYREDPEEEREELIRSQQSLITLVKSQMPTIEQARYTIQGQSSSNIRRKRIYIYIERERETHINMYTYLCTVHINILLHKSE